MKFKLKSNYKPTGDQPRAIEQLSAWLKQNNKHQTLLGVTGSGKTFTMANVIQNIQKPTLVISHNKTFLKKILWISMLDSFHHPTYDTKT